MKDFTHLHLHTEYSFLDGFGKVWNSDLKEKGELIVRLEQLGQKYAAITDHGTTAGWVRWDKACKAANIQPIFGVEGYYCNDRKVQGLPEAAKLQAVRGLSNRKDKNAATRAEEAKLGLDRRSHFVALAMNQEGLIEIQKTMSIAATEGFYKRPRWDWELIQQMKNCIFLTACHGGVFNYYLNKVEDNPNDKERLIESALVEARKWKKELGVRLYVELMAIDWPKQGSTDAMLYDIAKELNLPMVITNDCHYPNPEDWEGHDILLALQSSHWDDLQTKDVLNDPNRMRYDMQDLYVKSRKEMFTSFRKHHKWMPKKEVTKALDRTVEVAECCHHDIIKKKMIMPVIEVPQVKISDRYSDYSVQEKYLMYLIFRGWRKKIKPHITDLKQLKVYRRRLTEEVKLITKQGFTPYFILCNRLMKWVDQNGIARGPARGSSAGSLVSYLLDITMIDPIPHKLLFSRFIDPNRTDFPDIDMDFEDVRRHEIIQYFINTYGEDRVVMLGNFLTYKAKLTLKDVARLFKVPTFEVQKICDLVVQRSGADSRLSFCLKDTFEQHEFAKAFAEKYPKVVKFSEQMEGLTKSFSVHAAAVAISDEHINTYTAYRRFDKNSNFRVATMDRRDCEDIGMLKLDILGLNTMGIISEAKKLIKRRYDKDIDLEDLCRDVSYNGGDQEVYRSFADANTVGIFQFGSPGLTRLAKQMKIDKFDEISDATALHRPGPIHAGAMNKYPAYKFGKVKKKKALHPIIKKHTKDTYGLIIYQEQVMMIVRELGGFDWAQTNTVRKVMSKSGGAEYFMKTFWPTFKEGCAKHGLDEKTALKAFNQIMSFGSWAFNKSHSVSYAMVSYMCMWLKVHYPLEFITAYLNTVNDTSGDKTKEMIKEADRLGIPMRQANVNVSVDKFVIHGDAIVAGLSNIKHVGAKAVETIVENQPYRGLLDFVRRTNNRACNKRSVENLIKAGAFDDFHYNKKRLIENLPEIFKRMKQKSEKAKKEVKRLLKECRDGEEGYTAQELEEIKQEVTPVSFGKHMVRYYDDVWEELGDHIQITQLGDIELDDASQVKDKTAFKKKEVWVIGVFSKPDLKRLSQEVKEVIDQEQEQRYALANFEDDTDFIVLSFKDAVYHRYEQRLFSWKGRVLLVQGEVNVGWKKIYVNKVWEAEDARQYLLANRKPYKPALDYLFEHPLQRIFKRYGGIDKVRTKYGTEPLIRLTSKFLEHGESMWSIGVVTDMQKRTLRKGEHKGKTMYIVAFEDDTFKGTFLLHPSDSRFNKMEKDLNRLYDSTTPFMLRVQRDYKFNPEDTEFKQVSISIDKRNSWKSMKKEPFKIKRKSNG